MFRPRVIPVLLIKGNGLVKTVGFKSPKYIGDPINAVRIFNELESDEIIFLDITASNDGRTIPTGLVKKIGDEAFMPFAVGGGINEVDQVRKIISAGAEKVVINTAFPKNYKLVSNIAKVYGSQSVIVSIDTKKNIFGRYKVYTHGGLKSSSLDPVEHAINAENQGAGEIIINSISKDGITTGYDYDIISAVSEAVTIPVIACGGAGNYDHFKMAIDSGASAVAAGSKFVYHGPRDAVLINYPDRNELIELFN